MITDLRCGLMFTKLSADIEQIMGFLQCIEIVTARSTDVGMAIDLLRMSAKIDTPRLHSVCCRSTTDVRLATWIC